MDFEPDVKLFNKGIVVSLTLDSIHSDISPIGIHLHSEVGTQGYTTEDIGNCEEYHDETDSINSINNFHRQGSCDGYLNVDGGKSSITSGQAHSSNRPMIRTESRSRSREYTDLQEPETTDPEFSMEVTDVCFRFINSDLKTLQQESNNTDSGIDI